MEIFLRWFLSSQNPDGTASAVINIVTNYVNYLSNATQSALDRIGAISIGLINSK